MWAWGNAAPPPEVTSSSAETPNPIGQPIETIRVGQAVLATNPAGEEDLEFGTEVDPATWRHLFLRAEKEDGSWCDIELLRPKDWVAANDAVIGSTITVIVPECGIDGDAIVVNISACPEIQECAPGYQTVTATYRHESAQLAQVRIAGLAAPLRVTPNHLFWSKDRQHFVPAGSLFPNELVLTAYGDRQVLKATVTDE